MSAFGRCLCISLTAPLYYQTIVAFLCGVFEQFANRFSGVFKGPQLTGAAGREFSLTGRQGVSPRMSWRWAVPSLPGRRAGSFSEDRPLGWDPVARRAIGRAMEWPDSCLRRKLPAHRSFALLLRPEKFLGDVGAALGVLGVPVRADLLGIFRGQHGTAHHDLAVQARFVQGGDGLLHALEGGGH